MLRFDNHLRGPTEVVRQYQLLVLIRFHKNLGRVLILTGALAFACWGYLVLQQFWFQRGAGRVLEHMPRATGVTGPDEAAGDEPLVNPSHGEIIGRLEIPRIHISVVVVEGSDTSILGVAAGHIEGTALPGTMGNIGIAAHRDTFFRSLHEIRADDMIRVRTRHGVFQYVVDRTEVVAPTAIQVLHQTSHTELTLVTCYPFYYVGPAPKRFIVHAHKQS
jgi:LPXTG-site transpeptidase (sortase) family protein